MMFNIQFAVLNPSTEVTESVSTPNHLGKARGGLGTILTRIESLEVKV